MWLMAAAGNYQDRSFILTFMKFKYILINKGRWDYKFHIEHKVFIYQYRRIDMFILKYKKKISRRMRYGSLSLRLPNTFGCLWGLGITVALKILIIIFFITDNTKLLCKNCYSCNKKHQVHYKIKRKSTQHRYHLCFRFLQRVFIFTSQ